MNTYICKYLKYILKHFMSIRFVIKMHCKRLRQMQNSHGVLSASTWRAHNAPTALYRRPHSVATACCPKYLF